MATRRTISELKEIWQRAKDNLPVTTANILSDNEAELLNLNRTQLYSGYDGYGRQLRAYRNAQYAVEKHEMNPQPGYGVPDLYLTGSTYAKMKALINSQTVDLFSEDEKWKKLELQYGEAIGRLNTESINTLRKQVIQPNLVHAIAEQTGAIVR